LNPLTVREKAGVKLVQAASEAEKQYEAEAYSNIKLQSGQFEPGSRPGWLHFVCEGSQMRYIILPDWLFDQLASN
jgi:hypothetical protein